MRSRFLHAIRINEELKEQDKFA
uniref:Uncharacterized protein n=1 Tax=Arundo donax TaxID=35708 RepID=A0A0A8YYD5_ARUDO